jgi:hypothetical protein
VERLLGAPAEPSARPARAQRVAAPRAVRHAALVVGVEAGGLAAVAVVELVLVFTSTALSLSNALAQVVLVLIGAAALAAAGVGLWRVSGWARGPVVVLQLLLGLLGYNLAFTGDRPLLGVPVLVLVAAELYLLATPEARLAFAAR